jgi:hypothetical protein
MRDGARVVLNEDGLWGARDGTASAGRTLLSEQWADLAGVVDLYVHASPDLLPRQCDDIALARSYADAGLCAAVHRSHFAITAERAELARTATGFDLGGAVVLNDHVGGLDPVVVETALRSGARWVGMPTLSAAGFRDRLPADAPNRDVLCLGPGRLSVLDDEGQIRQSLREILGLVAQWRVPLGLGYGSLGGVVALCRAAAEAGVERLVLTYPDVMGLTDAEVIDIGHRPGVFLELCAFTLCPQGLMPHLAADVRRRALVWLEALGPDRVVLCSDGGMAGLPDGLALLRWAIGWLQESGVPPPAIDQMVRANPARVLGLA